MDLSPTINSMSEDAVRFRIVRNVGKVRMIFEASEDSRPPSEFSDYDMGYKVVLLPHLNYLFDVRRY